MNAHSPLAKLPAHLAERVRVLDNRPIAAGHYVMYWMSMAARGHENPALDTAIAAAAELGLPLFVYHALSERAPYASDRHYRFILEGARDVARELGQRKIGYAFHLERPGHRGPHLKTLGESAALIITEDFPGEPLRGWTRRLLQAIKAPIWCVDTACVVPMRLVGKAYTRAFHFRQWTRGLRAERLARPWPELKPASERFLPALPFVPVDLGSADLDALIAACDIDHTVAPVGHTQGGSVAGYARWEEFRRDKLRSYARHRTDPLKQGVSRMSAHLHYGHVSPLRIARQAAAVGGEGATKFLDELLVWRELAYTFCLYREDYDRMSALPEWAQETLSEHSADSRPAIFTEEELARGRTGDALWDAAQLSLLIHGELHNSVRMTWGKALLNWTANPEQALARMIELNHRYALDGRDPASYSGILWCLGQFDRPFRPPAPIFGAVRARSTQRHAARLDITAYAARCAVPTCDPPPDVAVIGAGIAGSFAARTLADHGISPVVFDKGRGPGGRMATRRYDSLSFDHGAQYFTARDPRLRRYADSWLGRGIITPWRARFARLEHGRVIPEEPENERYVGMPTMSRVVGYLHSDLDVTYGVQIGALERDADKWRVLGEGGADLGLFDAVLIAIPPAQAANLLQTCAPELALELLRIVVAPCWAVMIAFDTPLQRDRDSNRGLGLDAARITAGPLSWAALDSSKPGRSPGERWVLHATPEWSEAHLEDSPEAVQAALFEAFAEALAMSLPTPRLIEAHRWRYAQVTRPLGKSALWDSDRRLGYCGDGCLGGRVEAAFLSGAALAGQFLCAAAKPPASPSLPGQLTLL